MNKIVLFKTKFPAIMVGLKLGKLTVTENASLLQYCNKTIFFVVCDEGLTRTENHAASLWPIFISYHQCFLLKKARCHILFPHAFSAFVNSLVSTMHCYSENVYEKSTWQRFCCKRHVATSYFFKLKPFWQWQIWKNVPKKKNQLSRR